MKIYLFVNPSSGHHSARRLQLVLERLKAHSVIPEIFLVRTPTEIFACCSQINTEGEPPLVIVAGGDGTFNAVINGLNQGSATLAVLPFGTANVLAAEIGIRSLDDALDRIVAGKTRPLCIGVIEMENHSHRFVLMAGVGFDGAVVRDVWPLGKKLMRQVAYAVSALKNAIAWDESVFDIITPEGTITCHSAILCNASRYGGNFVLEPEGSLFAAGLTAICVTDHRRRTYIRILTDLFRGTKQQSRGLLRRPVSTIEIRGAKAIQIDGDFIGHAPARVFAEPDFARIIV